MYPYHTTLKKNLDSILKEGLIPKNTLGVVYLSEKPNSWWQGDEYITLKVDINDLRVRLSTFNEPNLDEVLCWGDCRT